MPRKQTEWTRAYNEKAYDRLAITVPKGCKSLIQAHAKAKDKTINGLVNELLMADMGLPEWPEKETQDAGQE